MREVLLGIAHAVHHFHVAILPHFFQCAHAALDAKGGIEVDDLVVGNGDSGAQGFVGAVIKHRNDRIEAIISPFEADEHQNTVAFHGADQGGQFGTRQGRNRAATQQYRASAT